MLHKHLFTLAHQVQYPQFYSTYKKVLKSQWDSYTDQQEKQEKQLRNMIHFAYTNVPYYHKLFKSLKILPNDITTLNDLEKLPILTKDIIKQNWDDFKPSNLSSMNYYEWSTGGSTGTPFKYRLQKSNRFLSAALLYRGWGYAGYELADKMILLGGSSLGIGTKSFVERKMNETTRNIKKLSSFDMGESDLNKYTKTLNSFQPRYINGYASSIYFYSKWLNDNETNFHSPNAVLTTAEKLLPNMRKTICDTFGCDVFDTYGLNDGGVSAFECNEHNGLHIDTEKSIMEIVDDNNCQIEEGIGHILATSLTNYVMPFIRYQTGDMGHLIEDKCGCGRESKLLKEIVGRSVDMLLTPEGKFVHGWFFLYIMWEHGKGVKEYQIVQKELNHIDIKLVIDEHFDEKQIDKIMNIVKEKSESWHLEFKFVDRIERTKAGKYKFIISEL